jgi:hypothetical protein
MILAVFFEPVPMVLVSGRSLPAVALLFAIQLLKAQASETKT